MQRIYSATGGNGPRKPPTRETSSDKPKQKPTKK